MSTLRVLLTLSLFGAALSAPLSLFHAQDDMPRQIALAFAGPTGMAVTWHTEVSTNSSTVWYGTSSDRLKYSVVGTEFTAGFKFGFQHTAVLRNLDFETRYYYAIEGSESVHSFKSQPEPASTRPLTIHVVGDMGMLHSEGVMESLNKADTDFILHLGDLSYADDSILTLDSYDGKWNAFKDAMQLSSAERPYMILPGNHEVTCSEIFPVCPPHQRNFTYYLNRYRMPYEESGAINNMWYSFDFGSVHFVQINTETDFPDSPIGQSGWLRGGPFGDQLGWLKQDLAKAVTNRKNVPWIIVSGHRPMYTSDKTKKACLPCRAAFEPILMEYEVDMYLSGHIHWYERMFPVVNNSATQTNYVEPRAPIHIINGSGGNVEGLTTLSAHTPVSDFFALLNDQDYGYGVLRVINATYLEWEFRSGGSDLLLDSISVVKTR